MISNEIMLISSCPISIPYVLNHVWGYLLLCVGRQEVHQLLAERQIWFEVLKTCLSFGFFYNKLFINLTARSC
jgi:uncharacterized membrane protein HdeD (DUF308 family)